MLGTSVPARLGIVSRTILELCPSVYMLGEQKGVAADTWKPKVPNLHDRLSNRELVHWVSQVLLLRSKYY